MNLKLSPEFSNFNLKGNVQKPKHFHSVFKLHTLGAVLTAGVAKVHMIWSLSQGIATCTSKLSFEGISHKWWDCCLKVDSLTTDSVGLITTHTAYSPTHERLKKRFEEMTVTASGKVNTLFFLSFFKSTWEIAWTLWVFMKEIVTSVKTVLILLGHHWAVVFQPWTECRHWDPVFLGVIWSSKLL